jgi:hypothetical protein
MSECRVIRGTVLAAGAFVVNLGLVGFGKIATTISWMMMVIYFTLIILRLTSFGRCSLPATQNESSP